MKTLLVSFFGLAAVFVSLLMIAPAPASAVELFNKNCAKGDAACSPCTNQAAAQQPGICSDNVGSTGENPLFGPNGIITKVVQIMVFIIGIIAVFTIIFAGFRMIISNGDPNTITTSRNAILYAIVGIVVAALSQSIVTFVLTKVG